MLPDLASSLASIEHALRRLERSALVSQLQAGIPRERVVAALRGTEIHASSALSALYAWKNGTSTAGGATIDDLSLIPGFYFLSIEDAVANYQAFVADARWRRAWLPLLANGGGDFYLVDQSAVHPGVVRHFRIDESEHPIEFASIGAMMATIADAFSQEAFFVDAMGYLEMDDLAFADIAAELNPAVSWWAD